MIGVALFSGEFLKLGIKDKFLGLIAVIAIGLLLYRRGG
jgi:hypothetical protein